MGSFEQNKCTAVGSIYVLVFFHGICAGTRLVIFETKQEITEHRSVLNRFVDKADYSENNSHACDCTGLSIRKWPITNGE